MAVRKQPAGSSLQGEDKRYLNLERGLSALESGVGIDRGPIVFRSIAIGSETG